MPQAVRIVVAAGIGLLLLAAAAWLLAVVVLVVSRLAFGQSGPPVGSIRRRVVEWCRVVRDVGELFDLLNI